MNNETKEFKVNQKNQIKYVIILLLIAIPIIIFCINMILDSNIELAKYSNSVKINSVDTIDANTLINHLHHQNISNQRSIYIFFVFLTVGVEFLILHLYYFTNIKILFDDKKIRLYSIYKKEATKEFLWENIKSIQFGNVYTPGSKIALYRMKVIYTKMVDNKLFNKVEFIPIKQFQNSKDLMNEIEKIGKNHMIDVFYMNE